MPCRRSRVLILALLALASVARGQSLPSGFVKIHLHQGFDSPTSLTFLPDGRMLITELGGRVLLADSLQVSPNPVLQLAADRSTLDRGLFSVRTDPDFAANGWIYLFWTTQEPRNRVSRFQMVGDQADPATELVVWESPGLAANYHHGGSLAFAATGHLYVGVGDQFKSNNAQKLGNPYGKILRLWPDGSIPADNPFVQAPNADPAIWALGIRNPFRLTVNPADDQLWIGDVGGNTDVAWEEINQGLAAANYGWPFQEGEACYISDCSDYVDAVFSFTHPDPTYWYGSEQGSMTLGPFYTDSVFPEEYQGALFFGDYSNRWIRVLHLDEALGNDPVVEVFEAPPDAGTIVDLAVGPDGALYTITLGWEIDGQAAPEGVWRYEYTGTDNLPPIAVADAAPRQGPPALAVQFLGSASWDPDSGPSPLEYSWDFGDGQLSSLADPTHVYTQRGSYLARLRVDDGEANVQADAIEITVGEAPRPRILLPLPGGRYRAGDTLQFLGRGRDAEDGALPDSAFTWEVRLIHHSHGHSYYGPIQGVSGGQFTIAESGHSPEDTHLLLSLTVVDTDGITRTQQRVLRPETTHFVLETEPTGIPVQLDGEYFWTPRSYQSVVGHRHVLRAQASYEIAGRKYAFARWENGSTRRSRSFVASAPGPGPGLDLLRMKAIYLPTLR